MATDTVWAARPVDTPAASQRRRTVVAGAVGSLVEFYDFGVYGYLATTLAGHFFPSSSQAAALLATLGIFAVAFVVRPIGSVVFGHIGDRSGRKAALALAVLMMAVATAVIGLLPTHASVGVAAPILLLAARLVQGLSAGGEISGAASMLAETAPDARRGLMTGLIQVGALSGLLVASAVVGLVELLTTPAQFVEFGWRIPFLLGLPTGLVGLRIRNRLEDSPAFQRVERSGAVATRPAVEVLREHWGALLKTIGLNAVNFAGYYIVFVYLTIYLETVGRLSRTQATWSTTVTLIVSALAVAPFAWLTDRVGRKPVLAGASFAFLVVTLPLFKVMQGDNLPLIVASQVGLGLCEAAILGGIWATLTELFPTRVRYTGIGLGYNISGVLVGGSAPYLATWLVQATDDKSAPAYFLMSVAVVTLLTLLAVPESANRKLPA